MKAKANQKDRGVYIGVEGKKPVYLRLSNDTTKDNSPTQDFYGSIGGGMSYHVTRELCEQIRR